VECVEQSWNFETATEALDICPRCYAAGGARFAGAEYQEQGEPVAKAEGAAAETAVAEPGPVVELGDMAAVPAAAETKRAADPTDAAGGGDEGSSKKAKTAL